MANELKKECGVGYYWCNTDNKCKPIQEDAHVGLVGGTPTNNAGGGQIDGIGVGPHGEPGVNMKKKRKVIPFGMFVRKQK